MKRIILIISLVAVGLMVPAVASAHSYHREAEPNGSWAAADFVSPSYWRSGQISSYSDYDWFKRDASTRITVHNTSGGRLRVYFPDTGHIYYLGRGGWAANWGGCPYRTHYVRLDAMTHGRINYTVTAS
jgi:hypothetical protein